VLLQLAQHVHGAEAVADQDGVGGRGGGTVRLAPPWGIGIPALDAAAFHAITHGHCWMRLDDQDTWVELAQGDVVVLPRDRAHSFCDRPGSPIRDLTHLSADLPLNHLPRTTELPETGSPDTAVLCGHLWFDDHAANPLLDALPPVLHLRAGGGTGPGGNWLAPLLHLMSLEDSTPTPGTEAVMARLGDLLVIETVRAHLAALPADSHLWLKALSDPHLSTALGLSHEQPEHPWTVAGLAGRAGLSRSTFSARFTELVGEPPLRYATRWRMHHAQRLLREPGQTVAAVSRRVGYQTEPAFSRAFTRFTGSTPGACRRTQHAQTAPV
jgi:AraC-like DNA-binding protein